MSGRRLINEYLFYEFGYDSQGSPSAVAEDWPFKLDKVGDVNRGGDDIEVFRFVHDGEAYYVLSGDTMMFYPVDGMTLEDLRLQQNGAAWIAQQDPIDLATSRIGDTLSPSASERRSTIENLAARACDSPRILEGLYLLATKTYLALVEDTSNGAVLIVGSGFEPRTVPFPQTSVWRRLALGVGEMLDKGLLARD